MRWTHQKIRQTFLDYFVNHTLAHQRVSGSSIIPRDDPTLLFCNAGMNQFKSALLGEERRSYSRATSVQPCVRAGGKHNDLDNVGKNGRHLTWFEMLGNWSFGDYGKREAIQMSWDVSVNIFGLDVSRLYVSVYKDDDESYGIWRDEIGVDPDHIYRFGDLENGDDENFWSMGPIGPCGPCTELFYDLGPEAGTSEEDVMGGEGDRYMEFWNNVFMQYDRDEDGVLTPLPALSVDTGLGLDRIAMILQDQLSVFDTDLFQPLINSIMELINADPTDPEQRVDLQVIADHVRALTFVISEGGQFSNEGRGYVLRRILRRAVRHGRRLGFDEPFLWRLTPVIAREFLGVYELPAHIIENTSTTLREEEARFFRTIDRGMVRIQAIMDTHEARGEREISGREAFELYDTFGFPVDLTQIEAEERGFTVDEAGFDQAMNTQRERSRRSARFYDDGAGEWVILREGGGRGFAAYGLSSLETRVMRYRQDGARVELILDQTPLYAESGGEVADRGTITCGALVIQVRDVQKINGVIHHFGQLQESPEGGSSEGGSSEGGSSEGGSSEGGSSEGGSSEGGSSEGGSSENSLVLNADTLLVVKVDVEYREQKTIHHSATHLMHAALKQIIGSHVEQKGSVVEADRLRFDFSHSQPLTSEELSEIESWVNEHIRRNEEVQIHQNVPIQEAKDQGVLALFGEKYGDEVRTVRAGSDSFELCGGNHVHRTGDIGYFMLTSESGVAAGVRRVEAVVGRSAEALVQQERGLLRAVGQTLKTDQARLLKRVVSLQDEIKQLKKALDKARKEGGGVNIDRLLASAIDVEGVSFVCAQIDLKDRASIATLMDTLRERAPKKMFLLGGVDQESDKVMLTAGVGHELKKDKRCHAGKLIGVVAPLVGGRGGGRPDFANGGGTIPDMLGEAIDQAPVLLRGLLT